MKLLIYIFLALLPFQLAAQYTHGTIDQVVDFKPGEGQNAGQSAEFFPENIFGPPSDKARQQVQAAAPEEVLSIGFGGEIVVTFSNLIVADGPGADFTIFENAFLNPVTGRVFAEPAVVSVSQDGMIYHEFPYDSLTLVGCAGITPVNGDKDCFDPEESGGDQFDLSDLGLQWIKFIKIKDISKQVKGNPQHPYYDPIITGFDLDAVAGLHLSEQVTGVDDVIEKSIIIKQNQIIISPELLSNAGEYRIADITGRIIMQGKIKSNIYVNDLNAGAYVFQAIIGEDIFFRKFIR